ncbi:hypothetical protein B1748_32505 [Paenibacillus sp. MY03]|uniref:DUF3889 domain-containing protein n=1 Tax=Paenibacillus sp. MY03 TaxID=302980 RepID=UPI000B3C213C|nr:DUF3889 domain-containing protein [Paenibacillus sp. MY03]OUS69034.1 hypothetical protein B1748_32505 [Paenibacillus sp. MY03]
MLRNVVVKTILLLMSLAQGESVSALHHDPLLLHTSSSGKEHTSIVQAAAPAYAKWGRLAVQETAKAYNGAAIVDYKYEGRSQLGEGIAEEKFRLWLNQSGREFGVRVTVSVEVATDTSRGVKFEELGH